ncbi:MAG TPA: copper-binding protein [Gallionellaceae bacterium]|nr:copper-binding protein [Gallionellaceae bacterium]
MYKSSTVVALAAVISLAAFSVYAEGTDGMQKDMGQKTATQVHQGRGIVNKMDLDAGKININHEAIKSLKWPKMTMDFNVQDISALAGIKPGMKVDFELAKFGNGYRITRIEQAKE